MKKDPTRDYVTEMFRAYAAAGMPTYETERNRIYAEALHKYAAMGAATAVAKAENAVERATPYLLDILAVEETMSLLERGGKENIARAVREVYCVSPTLPLRSGEIAERVRRFSLTYPASESAVYLWLKKARMLCAEYRGLRISVEDLKRYHVDSKSLE